MIQVPYYPLKRVNGSFGPELKRAVERVIDSGWFIRGKECEQFENEFAKFCGARYCVGVGNGLEALSLILKAYVALGRLQPGDAVIVPSNTFIATWLAVTSAGLIPMPAEPDENTGVLNLASVEKAFFHAQFSRLKVEAILAVHLYGRLCPMKKLMDFAEDRGLLLLEDAAQAHGATLQFDCVDGTYGVRAGNLGHAAGFSFYPGKNLGALGDAGAVVTNDKRLAETVRKLGNYGSEKKYQHEFPGENSRLDEMQAAILSLKLQRLDQDNARRNEIANRYLNEIRNPLVRLPLAAETAPKPSGIAGDENVFANCVWHIFAVHCAKPNGESCRDELQKHLTNLGIETLIHYPTPPHLQKAFVDNYGVGEYPVAERLAKQELSLPLHPFMTEEEILAVIHGVNSFKSDASEN